MNSTPPAACSGCGLLLALGEGEEAHTYRTAKNAPRPGKYFCNGSEDARHHMEGCEHPEYPAEGCANCEERLGLEPADVQVLITYPDEEAWEAARITGVDVYPIDVNLQPIPGLQRVYKVASTVPQPEHCHGPQEQDRS